MIRFFSRLHNRSSYSLVFSILGLGAAYYCAARLFLFFTPSPGYSPWISPAAGIAFCAVLLFGQRVLPGVFIGSVLVNFWPPIGAGEAGLFRSLTLAAGIGVGAALQALAGALLVRRIIGFPNPLDRARDAIAFFILSGPAASLIAATWGVATLADAGVLAPARLAIEWMIWWAADTLGVLLVAPLALVWLAQPRALWARRLLAVSLPMGIVFGLLATFMTHANTQEDRRISLEFERRAEDIVRLLDVTLDDYFDALSSLEALYASAGRVQRRQFRYFAGHLLERFPDIRALSWNPVLTDAQRAAYERTARRELDVGFEFRQRDRSGNLVRADRRPEYVVLYFVEPHEGNETALGFDRTSNPTEFEALRQARDRGRAVSTSPLTLVQETGRASSIIVFRPVYRNGATRDNEAARRRNIVGYVAEAFRITDVIRASLATIDETDVHFEIRDALSSALLYASPNPTSGTDPIHQTLYQRSQLEVAGRPWILEFRATESFTGRERSLQIWSILLGGVLLTILLGAFVLVVSGETAHVERLVEERTMELEKANKERADFTAMIIHDLRSPLSVISGVSETITEGYLGPMNQEQLLWLSRVGENAKRMSDIISDFLDLSKLEAGSVELIKTQVDLRELTAACLNSFFPLAEKKNITLSNHCPEGLPKITADERWLGQIFWNLLSNAVKFTGSGGEITVGCEAANGNIKAWVKDTGVGIPPAELPGLFRKYHQTESHETTSEKGTGLGLAICKMIVEAHHGDIWVESENGLGTTFYFTLPLNGH